MSGPFAKVIYKIDDWSMLFPFINALMGFASSSGPINGITVVRGVPHSWPPSPNLYCKSAVLLEGLGRPILNADGYPDYDGGALVSAEYRPPSFDFDGGRLDLNQMIDPGTPLTWCTQDVSYCTEEFTVDAPVTVPPKVPTKIRLSNSVLTLTFHRVPYMPMAAVRALIGRVNSSPFLGAATGLVKFNGADVHREWNDDGSVVQEVKMVFHERPTGYEWNSGPDPANPFTFTPVADSLGNKPYKTGDLNNLFL